MSVCNIYSLALFNTLIYKYAVVWRWTYVVVSPLPFGLEITVLIERSPPKMENDKIQSWCDRVTAPTKKSLFEDALILTTSHLLFWVNMSS